MLDVAGAVIVLERAATELECRGWTRNTLIDRASGCVCVRGALHIAAGASVGADRNGHYIDGLHMHIDDVDELSNSIRRTIGSSAHEGLTWWNDNRAENVGQVVDAVRRTAVRLSGAPS